MRCGRKSTTAWRYTGVWNPTGRFSLASDQSADRLAPDWVYTDVHCRRHRSTSTKARPPPENKRQRVRVCAPASRWTKCARADVRKSAIGLFKLNAHDREIFHTCVWCVIETSWFCRRRVGTWSQLMSGTWSSHGWVTTTARASDRHLRCSSVYF